MGENAALDGVVRTVDSEGRLTIGPERGGGYYETSVDRHGRITLVPVAVIPLRDLRRLHGAGAPPDGSAE